MPVPLRIRAGEAADLPRISTIQDGSPGAARWRPGDYLKYEFRVALKGEILAGYLAWRVLTEGECEILDLAVAPEFRRQGVARALLLSFLGGFQGAVFLEVRRSNQAARELYKCLGFEELTLRPDYYDDPPEAAIVMKFHS